MRTVKLRVFLAVPVYLTLNSCILAKMSWKKYGIGCRKTSTLSTYPGIWNISDFRWACCWFEVVAQIWEWNLHWYSVQVWSGVRCIFLSGFYSFMICLSLWTKSNPNLNELDFITMIPPFSIAHLSDGFVSFWMWPQFNFLQLTRRLLVIPFSSLLILVVPLHHFFSYLNYFQCEK